MMACKKGETEVVKLLLDNLEIDLNETNNLGRTPLMNACTDGHKDVVKLLLDHSERIELNAIDDCERTAFMWACFDGNKDVVKLLLECPKVVDKYIPEDFPIPQEIKNLIKMHSKRTNRWRPKIQK